MVALHKNLPLFSDKEGFGGSGGFGLGWRVSKGFGVQGMRRRAQS